MTTTTDITRYIDPLVFTIGEEEKRLSRWLTSNIGPRYHAWNFEAATIRTEEGRTIILLKVDESYKKPIVLFDMVFSNYIISDPLIQD